MNDFTNAVVHCAASAFALADPIVEIGALQHKDQENQLIQRLNFPGRPYIGCDLEMGPGVDRIEDICRMSFRDGEAGTVLALNILEHVYDVFAACAEIHRVVKPGGAAIVVCPFAVHLHPYPKDFWRFTDDSMRKLMEGFPWLIIGRKGYDTFPRSVFAIGFKRDVFPDFDLQCESFRKMLLKEGHDNESFIAHLRIKLGSIFARKKYFREFTHRNDLTLDLIRPTNR